MSAEQRAAVTRILTAGHGIEALVGVAGAGKSTLMEACRIAWDATGTTYAGATLAAAAAKNLTDASGIEARTVAAWLKQIEDGDGLRGIDVLVVDESAMVDDRAAAALMTEAARTGTKVVAIGDHLQLQAVGPGGWFRETHTLVGGLTLTENRRQEDAAERAALEVWRTGDHERALTMLAEGGRLHAAETADEARSQILMAWDELRSQEWMDPHDLIENIVVLAAKNSDVHALNLGAQQIRRVAGELGEEYTYALPGGDTLTLAVGDVVRVRENDYRSRRGEGPDMLNGYRAVVTSMRPDHSVEITWKVKDAHADEGFRYESGWVKADKVASGALTLGYSMTIAASQGLTTDTSLMYGHGANAFATYPGITRARKQNHLWLPLAVLEDEETRVRLGSARSEKELLERSIASFAQFLRQSRPDSMVSDLMPEPPEPAPLPKQRDLAAEEAQAEADRRLTQSRMAAAARAKSTIRRPSPADQAQSEALRKDEPELLEKHLQRLRQMREEREVEPWTSRTYGRISDAELNRTIERNARHARDQDAAADETEARLTELVDRIDQAKAEDTTPGQQWAAAAIGLVDAAEKSLTAVYTALDTATAEKRTAEQRTEWLAEISKTDKKSTLSVWMSGNTRKGQKKLTDQITAQRAVAWQEHSRAAVAAKVTLQEAWDLLRHSKFAEPLKANKPVPGDVDKVAEQLTEMRKLAQTHGHSIDVRNGQRVGYLQKEAAAQRREAASFRSSVADARTEKQQRQIIAEKFPRLHEQESTARAKGLQEQQARAAERGRGYTANASRYEPPAPTRSRGGPSMGR
ncbi:AAA family ATPase [Streptomyces sp. SID8379]|nr:AAA family ATPase [Streptomyces sp. SID8379]